MGISRATVLGAICVLALSACQSGAAVEVATDPTPTATIAPTETPTSVPAATPSPTPADARVGDVAPTPTPVADPHSTQIEEPTPTPTVAAHGEGASSKQGQAGPSTGSCVSNPTPVLTAAHTDLSKTDFVIPMIVPSGNWLKNRSYVRIKDDPAAGDGSGYEVPVYAPTDMVLTGVTKYIESTHDHQGNLVEQDQLDLRFVVSCEVEIGFDHVKRLVGDGAAVEPTEAVRDTRDAMVNVRVEYAAGDLIGYTRGTSTAHTWDLIMTNTTTTTAFVNQERYATPGDLSRLLTAACPYDYYEEPLRSQYLEWFGGWHGKPGGATECPGSPDVAGTVSGGWFKTPFDPTVFIADWALVVMDNADGSVEVNDDRLSLRVAAGQPTYAEAASIMTEHC